MFLSTASAIGMNQIFNDGIFTSCGYFYQRNHDFGITVVPRNSGLQNSGLPLSSGQFLGDQLFVPFLCSNSPLVVDSLSSGHFLGKRLSDFSNNCVFCLLFSH